MEMMILSLNAPAIQAIPDREEGQRDRAQGQRLSGRAGDASAPTVSRRWPRCRCRTPTWRRRELQRCVKDLGMVGALANGFSQIGDPNTIAYLDEKQYWPFWGVCDELDVPFYLHPRNPLPQDVAHLQRRRMAARPDLGVRPRDRGACAAPDGLGPVRQASEAADRPRPHGRRPAVQHVARRQCQRLDSEPQQLSGEEKDRRVFPEQLPHHRVGQLPHPGAAQRA